MIDDSGLNEFTNCVIHFPPKKKELKRSYSLSKQGRSFFHVVFLRVHVSLYMDGDYNIILHIQAISGLVPLARLSALTDLRPCVFGFNIW